MKRVFFKKALAVILASAVTVSVTPQSNVTTALSARRYVSLNTTFKTLKTGQKGYKLYLKNNTSDWKIRQVTTSDKSICTVYEKTESDVLLKAKKEGRATVKVRIDTKKRTKNNTKTLKCRINVISQTQDPAPEVPSEQDGKSKYVVTFDSDGGNAVSNQTVVHGETVKKPEDPVKQGYTFNGWYKDKNSESGYDFTSAVTENITLYARWNKNYTITFQTNGGNKIEDQTVESGKTVKSPQDPVKTGCTFVGWYLDSQLKQAYDFSAPVTKNITLYARWKVVDASTPVNSSGSTGGSSNGSSNNNTGNGNNNAGNNNTDNNNTGNDNTNIPSGSYMVKFHSNGGSSIADQLVKEGAYVNVPDIPLRNGYAFAGWYTDAATTKLFNFQETTVNSNLQLYACWVDTNDKTDTDGDGLTDALEEFYKTDKTKPDTDGDGLSDYEEVVLLGTDPTNPDTNGNGIPDGDEDTDGDGLSNLHEIKLGTNPIAKDTDEDGLTDAEEVNIHRTDPKLADTDQDGVSDGKEVELGTNPLVAESQFTVKLTSEPTNTDTVVPTVEMNLSGEQVETLCITPIENDTFFPEDMPGYMGQAYDFHVDGSFDDALISFQFDPSTLGPDAEPTIYHFDDKQQSLEEMPTTINGNIASAHVSHFSGYILIDKNAHEETFEWIENWDGDHKYTGVEIVFTIDDSGSMTWSDSTNQRLEVAQTLIDELPEKSKIGIVRFTDSVQKLTETLQADKNIAKSYLMQDNFKSTGNTRMYTAIDASFSLFESNDEDILKAMVVLSDGITEDTNMHTDMINKANQNHVKLYTVGLGEGNSDYFQNFLQPLAENTQGKFYLAKDAHELSGIYEDIGNKIDLETDSDGDGIPDYFEESIVIFSGAELHLDKNNPDTDGDGVPDGEELELKYKYNDDRSKVLVTAVLHSNPLKKDSDDDGFSDLVDATPFDPICYSDFDTYKKNKYQNEPTLTVFVEQPYRGSRNVVDENLQVGHTYVGLDYGENSSEYAGFYPEEAYDLAKVLFRISVNGMIHLDNGTYLTKGDLLGNSYLDPQGTDKGKPWHVAYTVPVTNDKIGQINEFAKNYKKKYNIISNNCTTYAVDLLQALGKPLNISQHTWSNDNSNIFEKIFLSTCTGYTPADAGQDIRSNYQDYIFMDSVQLKDGTSVDAVYDKSYPGCVDNYS